MYRGNALNALTRIAANDDENAATKTSLVRFTPTPGQIYVIVVDGNTATRGSGIVQLNITQDARLQPNQLRIVQAMEVEFKTVPGFLYRLQRSENLSDWQFDAGEPRKGTGDTLRWLISTEGRSHESYRLFPIAAADGN